MKYILIYKSWVLCTDGKWRLGGFHGKKLLIDTPIEAQTLLREKRIKTGKDIRIERGTW